MMRNRALDILSVLLLAATPVLADQPDWPISRGDVLGTGVADTTLADQYQLKWTFKTEQPIQSAPVIQGGTVYVGGTDSTLYAIRADSGERLWSAKTVGQIEAAPLVFRDKVYIGTVDGFFYAFDKNTGEEAWRHETDGKILSSATPVDADPPRVLFGSYDNHAYCLNANTGEVVWSFMTEGYVNGSSAVLGDMVYIGGCDGFLYQLKLDDGQLVGRTELGGEVAAMPTLHDGKAVLGHYQNQVVRIDLDSFTTDWRFADREFPYASGASIKGGRIVIGSRARRVYCIDFETGEEVWAFRCRGGVDSSPIIAGDKVVFGGSDGKVYILSMESGEQLWVYEIGESISASPALTDQLLVVAAEDGNVYAFESAGGLNHGGE